MLRPAPRRPSLGSTRGVWPDFRKPELTVTGQNSLVTGNLTGNFLENRLLFSRNISENIRKFSSLQDRRLKFPAQQNRELIRHNRELIRDNREFNSRIRESTGNLLKSRPLRCEIKSINICEFNSLRDGLPEMAGAPERESIRPLDRGTGERARDLFSSPNA